ncbi:MAG: helix-turn-helix domain-containing protein [Treponema sp.]|nr:helix-turn-helix domain-containing protein [Treponema sp.]
MNIQRACKARISTEERQVFLNKTLDCRRFLYNHTPHNGHSVKLPKRDHPARFK